MADVELWLAGDRKRGAGFPKGDASAQVAFIARYLGGYANDLAAQERLSGQSLGGYDEIRLAAWAIAERHGGAGGVGYRAGVIAWEAALRRADQLMERLRMRCVPLIREGRDGPAIGRAAHAVCQQAGVHVLDDDLIAYLKPIHGRYNGR